MTGTIVSFVIAYASIAWLLRYVSRHGFDAFVHYRLGVAVVLAAHASRASASHLRDVGPAEPFLARGQPGGGRTPGVQRR